MLDESIVSRLVAMDPDGQRGHLESLLQKYCESWTQDLAALRSALDDQQAEPVRKVAQRMKSASANLGARRIAALCAEAEHAAQTGILNEVVALFPELEPGYEQAVAELKRASGIEC